MIYNYKIISQFLKSSKKGKGANYEITQVNLTNICSMKQALHKRVDSL